LKHQNTNYHKHSGQIERPIVHQIRVLTSSTLFQSINQSIAHSVTLSDDLWQLRHSYLSSFRKERF